MEQAEDNPAGTETAEEIEPVPHTDEQAEQEEVNDDIEDDADDDEEDDEEDDADVADTGEDRQLGDRLDPNGPNDRTEHFAQQEDAPEEEPAAGES